MKKYENFCSSLENMKEIYNYTEPYDNVVLTGLVGLYEICFEQSWKMMKEILTNHGYEEGATGSPKLILKTAFQAGMIRDEALWLRALQERILTTIKSHWELSMRRKMSSIRCSAIYGKKWRQHGCSVLL